MLQGHREENDHELPDDLYYTILNGIRNEHNLKFTPFALNIRYVGTLW